MPDAAITVAAENLRQRGVHRVPLSKARTLMNRRAHQRMSKPHARPIHLDKPRVDRGRQVVHG
jgi:hypothetical protein